MIENEFMPKNGLLFLVFISSMFAIYYEIPDSFSESPFVTTDKPIYLDGEVITISGTVQNFETYPITIEILDPLGESINSIPIKPGYWGDYSTRMETGGKIWKNDGVYKVIATHASLPNSKTITFEYLHEIPKPIPPNSGPIGAEHAKATIVAKIYEDEFDFSKSQFQMQSPWIRFEDGETIHRYAAGVTLGFLFDDLGLGNGVDECYRFQGGKMYCTNAYYTFKFYINDKLVTQPAFREYVIQEGDRLSIVYDDESITASPDLVIPEWIREVAGFWCNDEIDTSSFVDAIEFLIQNEIIIVPTSEDDGVSDEVPSWIKTNACWWASSQISDKDFASGLKFLINNGIIVV